jgi:TatD DNase family protein
MFVDTHFHLNMIEETTEKQIQTIKNSIYEGLKTGINIYTSPDALEQNKDILPELEELGIKIACGWYPEYTPSNEIIEKLEEVIKKYNIFAIGEIGLEYYRMHKPKNEQIELFEMQMELARKLKKPVIIHSRDAFEDTINVLRKYKDVSGIIHCFSGTKEMIKHYLDIGYYISFAGNLTFKNARDLHEAIKYVPIDNIFFETDAPFLAPTPFRGQKNYPHFVKYTYTFAAQLLNVDLNELVFTVKENWERFLNKYSSLK